MSHTLHPEFYYSPYPSSLRALITTEEYEKQGKEYTKQELKQASLYYQHSFHFFVLSATQKLAFLWTKKALLLSVLMALLIGCLAVAMNGESAPASEGGYLVPATSFTQKVINLPYEFLDKIRQFTGQARKGFLVVPPEDGFGSVGENNHTLSEQLGNKGIPREKAGKETPEREVGETQTAALVDSTSFSTFIQSQTSKGMDIFSFAFCVARDFAADLIAKAFGWNGTTASSSPAA